jgi:hypothetical protein
VYHIRRMVEGLLRDGLKTNSHWDSTIQPMLVIVVQASLSVRIGDVLAPDNPKETSSSRPALHDSDVKLVLDGEPDVANIKSEWTMRNAKKSR